MSDFQVSYNSNPSKNKKERNYYKQQQKNIAKIEPNISGVFITCVRNKEALCLRECYDLFDEYAGKLSQSQTINNTDTVSNKNVGDDNDDNLDIEDLIAKELSEMKRPHSSNRFSSIQTGTHCVVFIKTNPPIDPNNLVYNILDDLKNQGKKKTRFSRRLIPITQTCYANTKDIQNMAQFILNPIFNNSQQSLDSKPKLQYAIVPNTRNNDKVDKKELIDMIAKIVGEDHTVNLNNPELTIIVEIFKNICGMSVLKDYNRLKKYNLEKIFDEHQGNNDGDKI